MLTASCITLKATIDDILDLMAKSLKVDEFWSILDEAENELDINVVLDPNRPDMPYYLADYRTDPAILYPLTEDQYDKLVWLCQAYGQLEQFGCFDVVVDIKPYD